MMNEMKLEDVMRELEAWVYDFKGTANQFCALCDAITLLREKDARIEQLLGDIRATVELANKRAEEKDADINGLEADNEHLTLVVEGKMKQISRMAQKIVDKDAEIERLREIIVKGDYSSYTARLATETWHRNNSEFIQRLEAEIERLSHHCDDCAGCTQWKCDCSNVRAEAITEFAERLKSTLIEGGIYPVLVKNAIEKIAEEMKGEGNEGSNDIDRGGSVLSDREGKKED